MSKLECGYLNIFADQNHRRYPSGIVHETIEAAVAAQSKENLKGAVVDVIRIIWNDSKANSPWMFSAEATAHRGDHG
jgi:hypothetical protein